MLPPIQRLVALAEGIAVIFLLCLAVAFLDQDYFSALFPERAFSLAFSILSLACLLISCQFVAGIAYVSLTARRRTQSEAAQEKISALLLNWLEGKAGTEKLYWPAIRTHKDFEKVLVEMLGLVRGSQRARLAELAVKLGFASRWRRLCVSPRWSSRKESLAKLALVANTRRRLSESWYLRDASHRVRAEAVRGLLRAGDPKDLNRAFRAAINLPLLGRLLVVEELRPFAGFLSWQVIPQLLETGSNREILAVLSMLSAWNVALPIASIEYSLASDSVPIRAAAIQIVPLLLPPERALGVVEAALQHEELTITQAALRAADRLRDSRLMPALLHCARAKNVSVARQACAVLATLGEGGTELLRYEVQTAARGEAARAVEGLQRAYTGSVGRS